MATRLFVCPGLLQFFSRGEIKRGVRCSPLRRAGSRPYIDAARLNELPRERIKARGGRRGVSRGQ